MTTFAGTDSFVETVSQGNVTAITQVLTGVEAPAVPEPATWTTMLTGFALLAVALRRRRRIAAST